MQLKMAMVYIAIVIGVLAALNYYPVSVSEEFVFQSKQDALSARAELYSSTMSGVDELTPETAAHVMSLLDAEETRVLVTDHRMRVLYDSTQGQSLVGSLALLGETRAALEGNDYFYAENGGDAITSVASCPVMIGGVPAGAVCVYDTDMSRAALIADLRRNFRSVSVVVLVVGVGVCVIISRIFGRKISELLETMRTVRDGDYACRAEERGDDEFTYLAKELNALSGHFEAVENMRRRFVSDASHELKTPLASIKLLADSMVQSDDVPADTMREFAMDIAEETERLDRLAERMLDITRIDAGVADPAETVDLTAAVERAGRMLEPLAAQQRIRIELELEDGCDIFASEDYAYRVVFNLIENAIKYNRPEGEVRVYLYDKDGEVTLIIQDTGIGIPAEDVSRVFERFYRVDKARSRAEGGSGLGLSIVYDAVRRYGGNITVESEQDVGTRFTVVFPSLKKREGAEQ